MVENWAGPALRPGGYIKSFETTPRMTVGRGGAVYRQSALLISVLFSAPGECLAWVLFFPSFFFLVSNYFL